MAYQEHLDLLKQGAKVWNKWRYEDDNRLIRPDLSDVDLSGLNIGEADLFWANCSMTNFSDANLKGVVFGGANLEFTNFSNANLDKAFIRESYLGLTNFKGASLKGADLFGSYLASADFSDADLTEANLGRAMLCNSQFNRANLTRAILGQANLIGTNFSEANLNSADIRGAILNNASLTGANMTGCLIYGSSSWNVDLEGTIQSNLVITSENEPLITVDNLDVAQFIYLLLNNQKIRDVIDTITSKVVLILGRFTDKRKKVLDAIRVELRKHNYLPVLVDFEKPTNRDITETISTLAHMARFVIADITDAKSIPQELDRIIPHLPSVVVQPLILTMQHEYGMFEHFTRFPWVLPVYRYIDEESLLQSLHEKVIAPAEQKALELEKR